MIWNEEAAYVDFKTVYNNLCAELGVSCINYWSCQHLAPYITYILKYLNKKIVTLDSKEILDKLEIIFQTFDHGADLIVHEKVLDLAGEVGVLDQGADDVVKYNQDRFVFCWSNILSSLIERLKPQYYDLLNPAEPNTCPCSCTQGETYKDWEAYTSGVWPEDEESSYYNFSSYRSWRTSSDVPECLCSGRIKTDNEGSY